ncbi:MAG: EAL domain-containing protein [Deltaproteobacteria bacterium]|nr:EAL domain-containing protein [Deltaproteobacteria bacterium]
MLEETRSDEIPPKLAYHPGAEILIIEDSAVQAEVLKKTLTMAGYEAAVARDGFRALEMIRQRRPALVISDIAMPLIDGYEVCRAIKKDEQLRDIPVILLTAFIDKTHVIRGLDSGADEYITKPYDPDLLLSTISRLLSGTDEGRITETSRGLEVEIDGNRHIISAGRGAIMEALLSTYENAMRQYKKLFVAESALQSLNETLEEKVRQRTAELEAEINERKMAEQEVRKLSTIIGQSANIIFVTDGQGMIRFVNPMFEKVSGYKGPEAVGRTPWDLQADPELREDIRHIWEGVLKGKPWSGVLKKEKKDGQEYWVESVMTPLRNESDETTGYLAIQEDVTEKRQTSARIKYLAQYDPVTGLLNRARFLSRLEEAISFNRVEGRAYSLLVANIDSFKLINDAYGHNTGDEALKSVARLLLTLSENNPRLRSDCAGEVLLSRLGADEFAVFFGCAARDEAVAVAEAIRAGAESISSGTPERMTLSIGGALYPEHSEDSTGLLTKADAALYRAKTLGRNRCHMFEPEDRDLENMQSRLSWKNRIVSAIEDGRFQPWFQPIMDLKSNSVNHFEVLARMQDETGEIVLPSRFIEIAETFGIINHIDRMIIDKAFRFRESRPPDGMTFSMNISGKNLGDSDFLSFLKGRIAGAGEMAKHFIFEITETAAVKDVDKAVRFINTLKEMGCQFSLDDFGVGFSSFTYLKMMDVDFLKIDGSFIKKLDTDHKDRLFVKTIVDVARELKIRTVAEFVERAETLEVLREYGVDFAQGYYIGRPGPGLNYLA